MRARDVRGTGTEAAHLCEWSCQSMGKTCGEPVYFYRNSLDFRQWEIQLLNMPEPLAADLCGEFWRLFAFLSYLYERLRRESLGVHELRDLMAKNT